MVRDLRRLADSTFDLLVVGAGIYGALAAWDAAQRGLRVALIDRGDFGAGTSFNSLKTLHGGLRSLQALSLPQMRLFIRERRAMARMMPHLLRPLPFCVPTSSRLTRSRLALRTALAVTDAVGRDRNDGVDDEALRLPGGRIVSRDECLALNPLVDPAGVTGGAVWFDYQMRQTERVTLSAVLSAVAGGAAAANYVEALALLRDGATVIGASVEDRRTGQRFDIRASVVLNAAGPWAGDDSRTPAGRRRPAAGGAAVRAMNLVIDRVTGTHACGGSVEGRFLFAVPWRDVSIVGTSHDVHDGDADAAARHARSRGGAARRRPAGISTRRFDRRRRCDSCTAGCCRWSTAHGAQVRLLKETQVVDHAGDGHPGLISIFSVRYTTARHSAETAVDMVMRTARPRWERHDGDLARRQRRLRLGRPPARRGSRAPTCPARRQRCGSAWPAATAPTGARWWAWRPNGPGLARPLAEGCAVTGAEILHAVRHEAAITLADAVLRRTEAGTAGHPGRGALEAAAAIMATALGWDTARVAAEVADVEAVYPAGAGSVS